ncbi:ferredoxin [Streptomyces sp. NPDC058221]|uniref:ferredoxin n=1 Tax=Streptomyces sp. NPDC058221 TaxID=3346388 RepID=UPI0036E923C0
MSGPSPAKWHIEVDDELCVGSGVCTGYAPQVFDLVDGVSAPGSPETEAGPEILLAAKACPVQAIRVTDKATGEVLAPTG